MRDWLRKLLTQVVLISQIAFYHKISRLIHRVAHNFEMIYCLIWEVYIAPRGVVVDIGKAHFQTVCVGKKAALGIRIRYLKVGSEVVSKISERKTAVMFAPSSIAKRTVFQFNPIRIVLNTVRRNFIIGIVYPRHICLIEKFFAASLQLGRYA